MSAVPLYQRDPAPESAPALYGVVVYGDGSPSRVTETVITFSSAEAADVFARERGWSDFEVTPLRFFVDRPVTPPMGSGLYLGRVVARARRGGAR